MQEKGRKILIDFDIEFERIDPTLLYENVAFDFMMEILEHYRAAYGSAKTINEIGLWPTVFPAFRPAYKHLSRDTTITLGVKDLQELYVLLVRMTIIIDHWTRDRNSYGKLDECVGIEDYEWFCSYRRQLLTSEEDDANEVIIRPIDIQLNVRQLFLDDRPKLLDAVFKTLVMYMSKSRVFEGVNERVQSMEMLMLKLFGVETIVPLNFHSAWFSLHIYLTTLKFKFMRFSKVKSLDYLYKVSLCTKLR